MFNFRLLAFLVVTPGLFLVSLSSTDVRGAGDEMSFQAKVDRDEVDLEESLNLQLSLQAAAGTQSPSETPRFDAPDFDILSQRESVSIDSRYENGRFAVKNRRDYLFVLRPRRAGRFKIRSIIARVAGKELRAPDLEVTVVASGAVTRPPKGYGGGGVGLRGAGKRTPGIEYFLRAETDRSQAYKGQQLILSYYLYSRVNVSRPIVTKYPILNGFLREDLEIPIIQGPIENEHVVLDGVPYARSLLARYAVYPLQEGKFKIDSMAVDLMVSNPEADDPFGQLFGNDDDPFGAGGMLNRMLKRALPGVRKANAQSELIQVEVLPLPQEGRPSDFSGGVGSFELSSAVDRTEVKLGDPVSVTLKIEGNGNVAAMKDPDIRWPEGVDLYESKGKNKLGRKGIAERVIEYLLIPRRAGDLEIPGFKVSFFDPEKKTYMQGSTSPISLHVQGDGPSSTLLGSQGSKQTKGNSQAKIGDIPDGLKALGEPMDGDGGVPAAPQDRLSKWMKVGIRGFGLLAVLFGAFWSYFGVQHLIELRKKGGAERSLFAAKKELMRSKNWDSLQQKAELGSGELPWADVLAFYERLSGAVYDLLDRSSGLPSRSLSRETLERELVGNQKVSLENWKKVDALLEYAEAVRFAVQAGVVTEQEARKKMGFWVSEGRSLEKALL